MASNIIPFGKHKGRTVEEILEIDPKYGEWITAQAWFAARFAAAYDEFKGRHHHGNEGNETPEHNRLQARFLDEDLCFNLYCLQIGRHHHNDHVERCVFSHGEKEIEQAASKIAADYRFPAGHKFGSLPYDREEFQRQGVKGNIRRWLKGRVIQLDKHNDRETISAAKEAAEKYPELTSLIDDYENAIRADFSRIRRSMEPQLLTWLDGQRASINLQVNFEDIADVRIGEDFRGLMFVEIKPTLGDEFPAVIRQVKRQITRAKTAHDHGRHVIVYEQFTGAGVDEPTMRRMIKASGISIWRFDEIERAREILLIPREGERE